MMNFKKITTLFLAGVISMSLVACGGEKETLTGNQKFINVFEKSVNARWTEQDKPTKTSDEEKTKKNVAILEKEIKSLEENLSGIDDPVLKKNAEDYIEGAKQQIESMKTNDYKLKDDYQQKSDALRKPSLMSMVETYGVKINSEHEQIYKDFKAQATVIDKENKSRTYAEELGTQIKLEKVTEEYGSVKLESVVENTSDFDFESISYNVQYKDADGVVIGTDFIYLNQFSKGQKQKVELMLFSDKAFETILITLDDVYIKN
ncbi:FxLYD domain-containing protein [Clostridium gasigenes]|uniref:FxLYD domain-containing protein n=1 Tax=Clostridium gasigenes TaxID=94869 RepID=UPI001C0BB508|nr:FxLYD domain-containing protein [Clostridium gasigenes]MBU3090372.1 FxLYD domain-containing protein [Clostridium gasigenes]